MFDIFDQFKTNFRHISTKYMFRPTVHFDQTLHSTSCLIRPNVIFDEVSFDELSWIPLCKQDLKTRSLTIVHESQISFYKNEQNNLNAGIHMILSLQV